MSDIETMRWGDTFTFNLLRVVQNAGDIPAVAVGLSSQIVNAKWHRPVVWKLMVSLNPQIVAADAALTFTAGLVINVGCGQVNTQVPFPPTAFAAPFAPVVQFFDVPASDIQCNFAVVGISAFPSPGSSLIVGATVAPHQEPSTMRDLRNHMLGGGTTPQRTYLNEDGLPRWMPAGFEDGELRYR